MCGERNPYMEPNTVSYVPFSDVSEEKISFERLEVNFDPLHMKWSSFWWFFAPVAMVTAWFVNEFVKLGSN